MKFLTVKTLSKVMLSRKFFPISNDVSGHCTGGNKGDNYILYDQYHCWEEFVYSSRLRADDSDYRIICIHAGIIEVMIFQQYKDYEKNLDFCTKIFKF